MRTKDSQKDSQGNLGQGNGDKGLIKKRKGIPDLTVERLFVLLAEMFEREVLECNKSAYTAPEPYAPGFIVAGAVCKRLADELRAQSKKQSNTELSGGAKTPDERNA